MEKGMISVDRWGEGSQAYFLTHLHSDHTQGLSSNWCNGPLFCSSITAKLFPTKFPDFDLSFIRVLEIGTSYSLSLLSPSTGSQTTLHFIAIDAHHCPGAVMFLFRGEFGCLLYTGDFRWEGTSERALLGKSMLLNALQGDNVDFLYMDNSYCNPAFLFPPREVAARQIVKIIASHPDHDVIIAINTLGKEDLLVHISQALNIKIWVWPERLETMHLLGFHDIFTTKTCLTRVRAVPFYSFSTDTVEELNKIRPTIGIMPSGLHWVKPINQNNYACRDQQYADLDAIKMFHPYIYSVPYSDHSCFNELEDFIKLVKPVNVRGIVTSSSAYIDPLYHLGRLCGPNKLIEGTNKKFNKLKIEGAESVQGKSVCGDKSIFTRFKRGNSRKFGSFGVRSGRVTLLRRRKRGANVTETGGIV